MRIIDILFVITAFFGVHTCLPAIKMLSIFKTSLTLQTKFLDHIASQQKDYFTKFCLGLWRIEMGTCISTIC